MTGCICFAGVFYLQQNCKVDIFMESSHVSRTVADIAATVNK